MTGTVRVVPRDEYVAFLDAGVEPAALGEQEFEGVCLTCHRLDEPFIGPALAGNSALTDRDRLESLVREGVAHDAGRRQHLDGRRRSTRSRLHEGARGKWQHELSPPPAPTGAATASRRGSRRPTTSGSASSTSGRRSSSSSRGGVLALLLRSQLATPNEDFLTRDSYNEVLTMHGTTMIFLVVVPLLLGLATYLVPLMIGARRHRVPAAARSSRSGSTSSAA